MKDLELTLSRDTVAPGEVHLADTPAAAPPTPLAWLRNAPTAPKPDHVRTPLDRLRRIREIGVPPEAPAAQVGRARRGGSRDHFQSQD